MGGIFLVALHSRRIGNEPLGRFEVDDVLQCVHQAEQGDSRDHGDLNVANHESLPRFLFLLVWQG